jgi:hypothetical protein
MKNDPAVRGYFQKKPGADKLFYALMRACAGLGDAFYLVQKSGVALGAPRHYGYAWLPPREVSGRPPVYLVLTLRLPRRIDSPRFVEIVEPYPGRYTHHMILSDAAQLDDELIGWLREAKGALA